jgi:hypothetical protein
VPGDLVTRGVADQLALFLLGHDVRSTTDDHLEDVCRRLTSRGVTEVAVAENFARSG